MCVKPSGLFSNNIYVQGLLQFVTTINESLITYHYKKKLYITYGYFCV